jgi:hypothetical protein
LTYDVSCVACGNYAATEEFLEDLPSYPDTRKKLERFLYETRGGGRRLLTSGPVQPNPDFERVVHLEEASGLYPDDGPVLDKYNNSVRRIASATNTLGQQFSLGVDRWLIPTMDDEEAQHIVELLVTEGYLCGGKGPAVKDPYVFYATPTGLTHADQLSHEARTAGDQVFIAACFAADLEPAVEAIRGAVSALGYKPKVVTEASTNLIDLDMYEGIRESRFIVADLTCNRQSVYYEIGFAHGLGIEFILTCRKDHFDDVHFDIAHRPILKWETEVELAEKLRKQIWQLFGKVEKPVA